MKNIAIFASGSGTNAENIIRYFLNHQQIKVIRVYSNNPNAGVIQKAKDLNVSTKIFDRDDLYNSSKVLDSLKFLDIHLVVLAGFLWIIPEMILREYKGRIINIHPALLPSYGGKGMYGMNVHKAVLENKEKESGISIHMVNEEYDKGDIIFQARCPVLQNDTPESLALRIHFLEYQHFPSVIEKFIDQLD